MVVGTRLLAPQTWHFWRGRGGATEVKQKQQQEAALAAFTQQQGAGHASNRV